jgi:hypothetical protein
MTALAARCASARPDEVQDCNGDNDVVLQLWGREESDDSSLEKFRTPCQERGLGC